MVAALATSATPSKKAKGIPAIVGRLHSKLDPSLLKSATDIKMALGSKDYNNFCNTFRNGLGEDDKASYPGMGQADKDAWILQWAIDPVTCSTRGFNRTTVYQDEQIVEEERWVTEEQLADVMKSSNHASIAIKAKELPEKEK